MARFNDPNTMTNVVAFTRAYFDSIFVEERLIGAKLPDLSMELFGKTFASPIMTPAFSHLKTFAAERENGLCEYSRAAAELHQVNWVGMMTNEEYATLSDTGAQTIRIIKPYADKDEIFSRSLSRRSAARLPSALTLTTASAIRAPMTFAADIR